MRLDVMSNVSGKSTNEFLRGLDRLSEMSNTIFIATSNFVNSMDEAFLDRFNHRQLVESAGASVAYELFRRSINELVSSGFVRCRDLGPGGPDIPRSALSSAPSHAGIRSVSEKLKRIASLAGKSSTRSVEEHMALAICKYTVGDQCELSDLLCALEKTFSPDLAYTSSPSIMNQGCDKIGRAHV